MLLIWYGFFDFCYKSHCNQFVSFGGFSLIFIAAHVRMQHREDLVLCSARGGCVSVAVGRNDFSRSVRCVEARSRAAVVQSQLYAQTVGCGPRGIGCDVRARVNRKRYRRGSRVRCTWPSFEKQKIDAHLARIVFRIWVMMMRVYDANGTIRWASFVAEKLRKLDWVLAGGARCSICTRV